MTGWLAQPTAPERSGSDAAQARRKLRSEVMRGHRASRVPVRPQAHSPGLGARVERTVSDASRCKAYLDPSWCRGPGREIPSAVLASPLRPRSTALALALPCVLALMATTCSSTPPAASPQPPPPPEEPAPASTSAWTMPGVSIVKPRIVLLFSPPPGGPEAGAIRAIAPDPPPLVEQDQWVYDFRYDHGELYLAGVHAIRLPAPRETPRMMGRFALEIYEGKALLERVRFDFPGLGTADLPHDGGARPLHGSPVSFTAKLSTRVGVTLPATPRGTRLELWDRATDRRWPLPWPAVEMTTAAAPEPDAGPDH